MRKYANYLILPLYLSFPAKLFAADQSQEASLLIAFLVAISAIALIAIAILIKRNHRLRKQKDEFRISYKELERDLVERSEKLHRINDQLYDEIAKHEITEELLHETQDYMHNIINSMPSILVGVTRNCIITHWNLAAQKATGIPHNDALGFPLGEIAPVMDIDPQLVNKAIDLQKTQKRENRQQGHGSKATYSDLTIYPLLSSDIEGAVIRIDDVTLRVRLETMMIQNEKMNSLGELAAGLAHEINNPLGIILQNIQNIKRRISTSLDKNQSAAEEIGISLEHINVYLESRKIINFIDDIKEAGERATFIVQNMLEFSRAQTNQYDYIRLPDLLERSVQLALQSINANKSEPTTTVEIEKHFPASSPAVYCSSVEIQQVILNLVSNAFHAFEEKRVKNNFILKLDLSFTDSHAVIEIQDNGPGMDTWTQRHIFDPFFTTKEVGKGTGLGLSVSYFIITEHHQGSIEVDSTLGQGTTFTIHLPIEGH